MKEITRRLYTKPVMLGMALVVGVALVVALFVATNRTSAANTFPIAAGNDEFETLGDGETYHDFASSPIPAGFFGTGSNAYSQLVPLVGVPINPAVSQVDTIIQRSQSISGPGGSTPIAMTGLSLKSINPITVTYSNGTPSETWNVQVGLSDYKASNGSMTVNASTFDSTLKVWPKFTFTRVGGGVPPKVLDTGAPTGPGSAAAGEDSTADAVDSGSAPAMAIAIAPCAAVSDFDSRIDASDSFATAAAASTSSCAPVTLSSVNSPWSSCGNGGFCIPQPITEEERWARHRPHPKGTKQVAAAQQIGVAE